ncbi:glycosyltransferase family 2 protein [Limosilactobacillus balticus]|uniref:Glycosyltransferase n=1 Tax=Limosilactobacillus balticus TaxID=2759747 RepID=A0ABS8RC93_9LACO|nr:glycosyltransferase [Limosilactobacillus balticus]MBB1127540.1 glycosyltransferase [Limosilactobacillus balticus]MCD7137686.1 glycosyltransferase [Limosilactobacillus balticus]
MSKSSIDFDVIVPIYNCEDYLERCLHSLITSRNNFINIILVDDGSTDKSGEIADKYAAMYSNVSVIHKENGGLSSARNAGLASIKGTYFTFVDPDDWVSKNYFTSVAEELSTHEVDILMVPYSRIYSDIKLDTFVFSNKISIFDEVKTRDIVMRRLYGVINSELNNPLTVDNLSTAWAKFYKTDKFSEIKFTAKSKIYSEDLWFNINCFLRAKSSEYFNKPKYYYFKENENSIVHTYNANMLDQYKRLYSQMHDYIIEYELDEKFLKALNNRIVINELIILRNIVMSNKNSFFKYRMIRNVLSDPMYANAYKKFSFDKLPQNYRFFYKCCKYRLSAITYLMLVVGEQLKTKIKQ